MDPLARQPRGRIRTAQALLAAAVSFAGFSLGYFGNELAIAIDQLIVFCGIGPP